MANTYLSKPVYLSGLSTIEAYLCPLNKKAIIKSITVANEQNSSGVFSVFWRDANNVGVGSTITDFPVLISGQVPPYGRIRVLDDFLVIKTGDSIRVMTTTSGKLNSLFSIVEQDI